MPRGSLRGILFHFLFSISNDSTSPVLNVALPPSRPNSSRSPLIIHPALSTLSVPFDPRNQTSSPFLVKCFPPLRNTLLFLGSRTMSSYEVGVEGFLVITRITVLRESLSIQSRLSDSSLSDSVLRFNLYLPSLVLSWRVG